MVRPIVSSLGIPGYLSAPTDPDLGDPEVYWSGSAVSYKDAMYRRPVPVGQADGRVLRLQNNTLRALDSSASGEII